MANSGPQLASPPALQSLETVSARLQEQRRTLGCWERVAASYGLSVGTAVRVAGGYEPHKPEIRQALGLPPLVTLQTGPGVAIASGAILITSSRICRCGRSFIPNHPSRTHCPTCRPPRKRERRLR